MRCADPMISTNPPTWRLYTHSLSPTPRGGLQCLYLGPCVGQWQLANRTAPTCTRYEYGNSTATIHRLGAGQSTTCAPRSNFGSGLYPWPYLIEPGPIRLRTPSPAHARQTNVKTDMNVDRKTPPSWIFGKDWEGMWHRRVRALLRRLHTQCFAR